MKPETKIPRGWRKLKKGTKELPDDRFQSISLPLHWVEMLSAAHYVSGYYTVIRKVTRK